MATPLSLQDGPQAITTVTAVPAVEPTDASLAGKAFATVGGNGIEIAGHCDANSGKLYLWRHLTGTLWLPVDIDKQDLKAIQVDSALPATAMAGYFSGLWLAGDAGMGSTGIYVVLQTGTATFDQLYASGRRL